MFHREFVLMVSVVLLTSSAWAQGVDRSSFPQGMQVHGNAEFIGHQESASAAASGEANVSRNSAATIRGNSSGGGVQIQGITKVTAEQKNVTATAVGKNNAAGNEVGVIGGK